MTPFQRFASTTLAVMATLVLVAPSAHAFQFSPFADEPPLRLDITASTTFAWHANNGDDDIYHSHYSSLTNRINFQMGWSDWAAMVRLDTDSFFHTLPSAELARTGSFEDQYRIGKFNLSYVRPDFEFTFGDSYVSFGRGLVLSMRKQPEDGMDSTLRGGKVVVRAPNDLGSLTLVGGIANPARVDPATGATLITVKDHLVPAQLEDGTPYQTEVGRVSLVDDWLFGAQAQANVGTMTLGAQGVLMKRGDIQTLATYAGDLSNIQLTQVAIGGLSLAAPLGDFGSFYVEGALEDERSPYKPTAAVLSAPTGKALYSSLSASKLDWGLSALAEFQYYDEFDGLYPSMGDSNFKQVQYSNVPTTEDITTDTRFNMFNRSVIGGHLRLDKTVTQELGLFVNYGYWRPKYGNDYSTVGMPIADNVHDISGGGTYRLPSGQISLSTGLRRDAFAESAAGKSPGDLFYREYWVRENLETHLYGPWAIDLLGRQRHIFHLGKNADNGGVPWNQGSAYFSLRYAPYITATIGFDYTEAPISPSHGAMYYNGSLKWNYLQGSSVQLTMGEQLGEYKCIGGTCRLLPDFSGVKVEWVQRY